jgi:hypothetical protein
MHLSLRKTLVAEAPDALYLIETGHPRGAAVPAATGEEASS